MQFAGRAQESLGSWLDCVKMFVEQTDSTGQVSPAKANRDHFLVVSLIVTHVGHARAGDNSRHQVSIFPCIFFLASCSQVVALSLNLENNFKEMKKSSVQQTVMWCLGKTF